MAQAGTPWQRAAFQAFRRLQLADALRHRRALAQQLTDPRWFTLPRERGFLTFAPDQLPDLTDLVIYCRRLLDDPEVESRPSALKPFLRMDYLDKEAWSADHPILRWALAPELIASVADYLGMVPVLKCISLWSSEYTPDSPQSSQLFHCDGDESTQIKVFIYLNHVDEMAGPLTLIDACRSDRAKRILRYRYDKKSYRVADATMEKALEGDCGEACLGPPGTVVVADTSRCFHYGSRVTRPSQRRETLVLQYVTPLAFNLPWQFDAELPYRHVDDPRMTAAQRLVVGASLAAVPGATLQPAC